MLSAEQVEVWQSAIALWDGDARKKKAFLATIRDAIAEHDYDAAYSLCEAILQRDNVDVLLRTKLHFSLAITGPGHAADGHLKDAAVAIETFARIAGGETDQADQAIARWREKIARVQSKLKPVYEETEDDDDLQGKGPDPTTSLPIRSGPVSKLPALLTKSTASKAAEPYLSLDGATDSKPKSRIMTPEEAAQAFLDKRVLDQKLRQSMNRLPASQRRAAANNSFRLGQGTRGTLKAARSKLALAELFKEQADDQSGEVAVETKSAEPTPAVEEDIAPADQKQGETATVGDEKAKSFWEMDFPERYDYYVKVAGKCSSHEEYDALEAKAIEELRSKQERDQEEESNAQMDKDREDEQLEDEYRMREG